MEHQTRTPSTEPGILNKIVALLIDDELGALNTLRGMLSQYCPQVLIAGTASSVQEAVQAVTSIEPDLLFLDI